MKVEITIKLTSDSLSGESLAKLQDIVQDIRNLESEQEPAKAPAKPEPAKTKAKAEPAKTKAAAKPAPAKPEPAPAPAPEPVKAEPAPVKAEHEDSLFGDLPPSVETVRTVLAPLMKTHGVKIRKELSNLGVSQLSEIKDAETLAKLYAFAQALSNS